MNALLLYVQYNLSTVSGYFHNSSDVLRFYSFLGIIFIRNCHMRRLLGVSSKLLGLGDSLLDTADHVESGLRESIVLTVKNLLEGSDSVLKRDKSSLNTGENLGDGEGLRQESLDLSSSLDGQLVLLGKLIHTKNGNDILERLVSLEGLLDVGSNVVVLLADNIDIQKSRLGIKRVDSGVDTQLGNTSGQDGGGVKMGEGGGGSRISQIIGGHVDGLDGSDGTLLGGGNSLLEGTHIGGQSGLVTDSGGNSTKQSGHLGTGLGESENVVNEEQHILTLLVSEVLGNGQTSKGDSGSGSGRLVHLTEDEGDLGLTLEVDDTSLLHLSVKIVTLSGSLTDTAENGETTMGLGNVVNQLLDENGLTDTGTTEETNLTTSGVRGEEVDDLNTGLENLSSGRLLSEGRGVSVDGKVLGSLDRSSLVNGLTTDVDDSTKGTSANGDSDGSTSVSDRGASDKTLSTVHGNGSDGVLTEMLGNLEDELVTLTTVNGQSVKNSGEVILLELDILLLVFWLV
jgi:hypothetical protein